MRPNLSYLIKDEVVRRFEDVVKEEIRLHNIAIKKTEDKILSIDNQIDKLHLQINEDRMKNEKLHIETRNLFKDERSSLENDFKHEREYLKSNVNHLNEKIREFDESNLNMCSKKDLESCQKHIFSFFNDAYYSIIEQFEDFKNYLYENNSSILENVLVRLENLEKSHRELSERLEVYRCSSSVQKIESESVLRELQVYKKSMLIIDKKIENIYTLIERLSARIS